MLIPVILISLLILGLVIFISFFVVSLLVEKSDIVAKFVAKNTGGKAVYLKSCFGTVYRTIAKEDAFGEIYAPVYFASKVGGAILEEDGTVSKNSESSYIKKWAEIK